MIGTVDFNMILELNRILKKKGYDYSVHSIGGCASCGLNLRCEGEESDLEDVMKGCSESGRSLYSWYHLYIP